MQPIDTGAFIALLRKEKGLTQTALAQKLNISNRTVSKWENGDGFPDITILPEIADILDVTVDELLAGKRTQNSSKSNASPEFICDFKETAKDYSKLFKLTVSKKLPAWFTVTILFCIFISAIDIFAIFSFSDNIIKIFIPSVILFVFVCLIELAAPYILAQIQIYQSKQINGGEKVNAHIEISDRIIIKQGKTKQEFALTDVTGFYDKKNIFILRYHKNVYSYIDKSSFVKGSAEEFAEFIKPHIKPQKESKALRVLQIVLVSFVCCCTLILTLASAFTITSAPVKDSIDFSDMTNEQLAEIQDSTMLCSAVYSKIDENIEYDNYEVSVSRLNHYEKNFLTAYDFYNEYLNGGLCQYLCNSGYFADELASALRLIKMDEIAEEYENFITENNIDLSKYKKDTVYEEELKKYPFDAADKSIQECFDEDKYIDALADYVKENMDNF